jgi:hypothetical protein
MRCAHVCICMYVSRELVDLLGQTKPPTASKEDIDNSGLEIIRRDQVVAREQEGRVASNCIERVSCVEVMVYRRARC